MAHKPLPLSFPGTPRCPHPGPEAQSPGGGPQAPVDLGPPLQQLQPHVATQVTLCLRNACSMTCYELLAVIFTTETSEHSPALAPAPAPAPGRAPPPMACHRSCYDHATRVFCSLARLYDGF